MRPIEPLLSDWAAYTELLLADATFDDDESADAQGTPQPPARPPTRAGSAPGARAHAG